MWTSKKTQQRLAHMEAFASHKGLTFKAADDMGTIGFLRSFNLFGTGGRKKILRMAYKQDEYYNELAVFDYRYVISSGNSSKVVEQTVYFRRDKGLGLPQFRLLPQRWYHKIYKYFGYQDLDVPESVKFSNNYILKGGDEHYTRKQFDGPILAYFEKNKGWHAEGDNFYFILYKPGKLMNYQDLETLHKAGEELFKLFIANKLPP